MRHIDIHRPFDALVGQTLVAIDGKEYISRARTILFDLDEAIVDESLREFTWIGDNE